METAIQTDEGFPQAKQTWLRNAGITSLFIYAFFWLLDIEISRIGESLMFIFFVVMLFTNKPRFLLKEPIPYIFIAWVIFQIFMYQWATVRFPELAEDHINEARTITNVFMFMVVAWWLGGESKNIIVMLLLCATGYLLGATFQDGGLLDGINAFFKHERMDFGYQNAQHTAVYSTFVFLSLICLRNRILSYIPKNYTLLAKILIFTTITFSIVAIVASEARATWLGLIVVTAIFTTIYIVREIRKYFINNKKQKFSRKLLAKETIWFAISMAVILVTLGLYNTPKVINNRLQMEYSEIHMLMEGNTENLRLGSVGIRIDSWKKAIEWIKERPITGWGAQSRKALLLKSDWSSWLKKTFRHLHNSYFEILVSYGIVGFSLFASLFAYIWYRSWQAWKAGIIPDAIMLFAGLWSIYWLIVNFFESYIIFNATGNYINAIVAGALYTYHLKRISIRNNQPVN